MDKSPPPPLLPILRSQQQAELLALLLGDPELEVSVSELAERTGVPYASVHREVERGEATGLLTSRRVGRTRLIRANASSPYYEGLADVLTKAFGVPHLVAGALDEIAGIEQVFIYGSWAARHQGDRRAGGGEGTGQRRADAARGASDEGDAAVEPEKAQRIVLHVHMLNDGWARRASAARIAA